MKTELQILREWEQRFPGKNPTRQQIDLALEFANGRRNVAEPARAGSGKTSSNYMGLTWAPELLIASRWPEIKVVQFNTANRIEGQEKVREMEKASLLPPGRVEVTTFHSMCDGFLRAKFRDRKFGDPDQEREYKHAAKALGFKPDAAGKYKDDEHDLIKLVGDIAVKGKEMVPFAKAGHELVDMAMDFELIATAEQEDAGWTQAAVCDAALRTMLLGLEWDGTRSFTDMIWWPLRRGWIYPCATLVLIDEFQDLSPFMYAVARKIVRFDRGGRLFMVGDPYQCIYEWRGANVQAMGEFASEFKAAILKLTGTFRCPVSVVDLAKQVVGDYESIPGAKQGSVTQLAFDKLHEKAKPGDFVLSRKTAPLARVCMRLLKHGIPAKIEGSQLGKGLVSLIKKLKPKSMPDFLEKLNKYIEKEIGRFEELAKTKKSAQNHIDMVKDQRDVLVAMSEGISGLKELTARVESLFVDSKTGETPKQVICSTVHKAKGREANRVFLLEESFMWKPPTWGLPGQPAPVPAKAPGSTWEILATEEMRLWYVAVTRTKDELIILGGVPGIKPIEEKK
jgi:superfamily I DNA/RNA helicase